MRHWILAVFFLALAVPAMGATAEAEVMTDRISMFAQPMRTATGTTQTAEWNLHKITLKDSDGNTDAELSTLADSYIIQQLGLGLSSPLWQLHVAAQAGVTNDGIALEKADDTHAAPLRFLDSEGNEIWAVGALGGAFAGSDDDFGIWEDNDSSSVRLIIKDATGRVGLYTLTPQARLHLRDDTDQAAVEMLRLQGDRANAADGDEVYISGTLNNDAGDEKEFGRARFVAEDITEGGEDGALAWSLLVNGTMRERARLNNDGLQLVSPSMRHTASSPLYYFQRTNNANLSGIVWRNAAGNQLWQIVATGTTDGDNLRFNRVNAAGNYIFGGANVGIGSIVPSAPLDVLGFYQFLPSTDNYFNNGVNMRPMRIIGSSTYSPGIHLRDGPTGNDWLIYQDVTDSDKLKFRNESSQRLEITTGGDMTLGGQLVVEGGLDNTGDMVSHQDSPNAPAVELSTASGQGGGYTSGAEYDDHRLATLASDTESTVWSKTTGAFEGVYMAIVDVLAAESGSDPLIPLGAERAHVVWIGYGINVTATVTQLAQYSGNYEIKADFSGGDIRVRVDNTYPADIDLTVFVDLKYMEKD